jgi:hypothetical protein
MRRNLRVQDCIVFSLHVFGIVRPKNFTRYLPRFFASGKERTALKTEENLWPLGRHTEVETFVSCPDCL